MPSAWINKISKSLIFKFNLSRTKPFCFLFKLILKNIFKFIKIYRNYFLISKNIFSTWLNLKLQKHLYIHMFSPKRFILREQRAFCILRFLNHSHYLCSLSCIYQWHLPLDCSPDLMYLFPPLISFQLISFHLPQGIKHTGVACVWVTARAWSTQSAFPREYMSNPILLSLDLARSSVTIPHTINLLYN